MELICWRRLLTASHIRRSHWIAGIQDRDHDVGIQDREAGVGHVVGIGVAQSREVEHVVKVEVVATFTTNRRHADLVRDLLHVVEVVVELVAIAGVLEVGAEADHQKDDLVRIIEVALEVVFLLGISLGSLDPQAQNQPKSVDDFVSYCQQIQRRQDKEDRREKGEAVSSDDDKCGSRAGSPTSFKHPFGVRTAGQSDGIKINIVNATSISTKTPQERVLDSSQLRLVYPVSSGITHKENTDKWTPVVKTKPLKTCSDEQKKYVGITSLEAERYRAEASSSTDHLLPPPPAPPVLTGLGGLLPPPPPPPKLTAFDTLLPPPPPLPQLLVLPPEEEMIMHEPDKVEMTGPQDVANVLARRADAQLKLATNPNDYEAIRVVKEVDDQMASWAAAKNLPGKYTGSTGVNVLSPEELQPHDPRYNAWVKKVSYCSNRLFRLCTSCLVQKFYQEVFFYYFPVCFRF
ncbi:unnamed protein product [Angiostrongylus costaricensis]|uniref:WH2 domain-containing protein n=1 Tax=Angiostrongylus costaricensis TaxID=334426 RepID=A0A0R3PLB3_ANGCS|nr:unnamed protein product [Angiostrongylus costaricensis]